MTRSFLSLVAAAALVTGACNSSEKSSIGIPGASAAGSQTTTTASKDSPTSSDRDFVQNMVIANMAEAELGKMAVQQAANADVKKFGQMMADDHGKAGDQLKSIAAQHGIPLPTELDAKHRDLQNRLAGLRGAAFDTEYTSAMVDGHQAVLQQLESRTDRSTTPGAAPSGAGSPPAAVAPQKSDNAATMSLNKWAADAYPVVQKHLESARMLQETAGGHRTN